MAKIDVAEMIYTLTTPVVNLWPDLLGGKKFKVKGHEITSKPSGNFVFDKDHPDLKPMIAKAKAVIAKLQPNWDEAKVKEILQKAFQKGEDIAAEKRAEAEKVGKKANEKVMEFLQGKIVMKSSSKFVPAYGAIVNGKAVDFKGDDVIKANEKLFYSGVLCLAEFKFDPMETQQGDFLVKYLQSVFSLNKGERIGGGEKSASSTFASYAGKVTNENPTDGLEDIM